MHIWQDLLQMKGQLIQVHFQMVRLEFYDEVLRWSLTLKSCGQRYGTKSICALN
jgi:hypothetical protein